MYILQARAVQLTAVGSLTVERGAVMYNAVQYTAVLASCNAVICAV